MQLVPMDGQALRERDRHLWDLQPIKDVNEQTSPSPHAQVGQQTADASTASQVSM